MTGPRARVVLKRAAIGIAAVLLLVLAIAAYEMLGPRTTPEGQPPLLELSAKNLAEFRERFNGAAGDRRVLALLSPT
ncbi:MAG TPA: hypothetical protein VGR67_07185 [Candidatus Polarisedimenticolia bacterium]|jgi:hypothetical protein|nr:hypothetical protein [Candidatus Polarisedimenticolia bacterium]